MKTLVSLKCLSLNITVKKLWCSQLADEKMPRQPIWSYIQIPINWLIFPKRRANHSRMQPIRLSSIMLIDKGLPWQPAYLFLAAKLNAGNIGLWTSSWILIHAPLAIVNTKYDNHFSIFRLRLIVWMIFHEWLLKDFAIKNILSVMKINNG